VKIEVRCDGCGKGYLVDLGKVPATGAIVPCQVCGNTITLKAQAAKQNPSSQKADHAQSASSRGAAAEAERKDEVCCPRCQFHFVPGTKTTAKSSGRQTLLVVEDMEYFLEIARDALGGRYELKTAKTLDEARTHLRAGGIDLLLLDLTLEKGEDGLQLLREAPAKTCPVLLFTAQDESEMYGEEWENLLALGIDDVIIKGMNMDEALLRKVAEMLGEPAPQESYRR
jgi:CheY-like chemotaxis protein